jgi:[acyl-carrier-protein] S-malonyltransferase
VTAVHSHGIAARVCGAPISVAEVDARMTAVRSGAFGPRLGDPHSAEGRNARRWVVQLLCAERIVRAELVARGIATDSARAPLRVERALALGGVAAAVLATVPAAAALAESLTAPPPEAAVRDYYERNGDLYAGVRYTEARAGIAAELRAAAADRAFSRWLEGRLADDVVLSPGFEHPADPRSDDATHRH